MNGLRLNLIRFSVFVIRFSDNENKASKTEQQKPDIGHRKWSSSLFRQGESPTGFSYWCNKAKAETRSLGFSDFIKIILFSSLKILYVTK